MKSSKYFHESRPQSWRLAQDYGSISVDEANDKYQGSCYHPAPLAPPADPAAAAGYGGSLRPDSGHTEWVNARAHQTAFTTCFSPNTRAPYAAGGTTYDIDYTSQQEGSSLTAPTVAALTARSYHPGGIAGGVTYERCIGGHVLINH